MSQVYGNYDDMKRKIRKLKKLEKKIRFQGIEDQDNKATKGKQKGLGLVWDEFFDLQEQSTKSVKYPFNKLVLMDKDELKDVIGEYFYHVYFRFYKENKITDIPVYDSEILIHIGLPLNSGSDDIKKKYRELAKLYHPDAGGDNTKFIELMEDYKRLNNVNRRLE